MRGRLIAALATAAVVAVCAQNPLSAQQKQLPLPPGGFKLPPPAQVKPYRRFWLGSIGWFCQRSIGGGITATARRVLRAG
jgi:hypothetical protein